MNDQSLRYLRQGISGGLSKAYRPERELPVHLEELVHRLKTADKEKAGSDEHAENGNLARNDDTALEKLDRYVARLDAYLPDWLVRAEKWLRKPERRIARIVVSLALMAGGVFSFLPVLGLWMLPLGLIVIAQDAPFLQRPLVRLFAWIEHQVRAWRDR